MPQFFTLTRNDRAEFERTGVLLLPGFLPLADAAAMSGAVWADLAVGALLAVCGALGLARPRRAIASAIGAIGLVLLVTPLALGLPFTLGCCSSKFQM